MRDDEKYPFLKSLKDKYRLVILNDITFEERLAIKITPLLFLFIALIVGFFMIFITFLLFSYTPLKEYVPGKTNVEVKEEVISLSVKVDSLVNLLEGRDLYIESLKRILSGESPTEEIIENNSYDLPKIEDLETSNNDSLFRKKIEKKSSGDYIQVSNEKSIYFFPPVLGDFTQGYSIRLNHLGVDIVAKKGSLISSVADGRVILSDWTQGGGLTINIQHSDGFLSVYQHNSELLKNVGDVVKIGEAIAVIGNSGELTSGPHLHFELWKNGESLNPINYINF